MVQDIEMDDGVHQVTDVAFEKSCTIITANQHCLIRLPSEGLKIIQLRPDGVISLGKFGSFEVNGVLGYCFGQSFEILDNLKVKPIQNIIFNGDKPSEDEISQDDLTNLLLNNSDNNRNIIDIGSKVQKLTAEDIENLKKSGAGGEVGQSIIEKIIQGHEGFDKKTIFSQQKYLKRKQQKFLRRFTIEYLGSSQLLKYYIEREVSRVLDMSEETLGLMLNLANVRPGGKYLLIDETGGVILYAMMERMQGEGTILVAHDNEHPNHIALKYSDYPVELQNKMIKTVSWLQFFEPENEKIDWENYSEEVINEMKSNKKQQYFRRKARAEEVNGSIDMVEEGNFDGLIAVSTLYIPSLLDSILEKIGGSRPIVVYSQFKETLLETQHELSKDLRVLAPSIYETRARPYQTIPGRIHPVMSMRGGGGYLLWGTRVFPKEGGITAVGRGIVKRAQRKKQKTEQDATAKKETESQSDTVTTEQ